MLQSFCRPVLGSLFLPLSALPGVPKPSPYVFKGSLFNSIFVLNPGARERDVKSQVLRPRLRDPQVPRALQEPWDLCENFKKLSLITMRIT